MSCYSRPKNEASRVSNERKADCVKYKLLGSCDAGKKCSYRHVVKAHRRYTEYVPFPEKVPISIAVGRHGSNLRSALKAGNLQSRCIMVPSTEHKFKTEVKVVAVDQQTLDMAVKNLHVLFSQLYPMGPSWYYFQTEGITADVLLEFQEYEGRIPTHTYHVKREQKMYEICTQQQVSHGVSASECSADTRLVDFEKLNPKCSPLDSMDQLQSALDSAIEGRPPADKMKGLPTRSHMRARIMLGYKEHIKTHLQGALEWMCKPENQQPGFTAKLEGRFGKTLWSNLPEDVLASDDPLDVKTFAEFVFSDINYSQLFNTDVKSENASSLCTVLQDGTQSTTVLETYDLKFTSKGERVDLRLRNNSGRLEVVMAKKNERKVVVFDMLCLHMKHDIRLSLNQFETVPKGDSTIQKLLRTLTMLNSNTLKFVPHASEWDVTFIRHKIRETFFVDEKYMVSVTTVEEHCINWREMCHGMPHQPIVVGPKDYDKPHMEIEFHSIIWECMFGKAIGLSPEQSLALFMETPAISPKVVSLIPPDPWDVATILKDMDEVFEYLDMLNKSLGTISEKK